MKRVITVLLVLSLLLACCLTAVSFAANDSRVTAGETDMWEVLYSGSLEEINQYFTENNMSGGLPVIPPTQTRVNEFLKYTDLPADTLIGVFTPSNREVLVYHVAVNGVMAGCRPEWMPILIACARAMNDPDWQASLGGTDGCSPYILLNGPVARQLRFDNGQGEITEEANMALGRFVDLAMMNMCGLYIKENLMAPFGYVMPWTIVENEELCAEVDWNPYHVQQGYGWNDSTVTLGSSMTWGGNLPPSTADAEHIKDAIAYDITEKTDNALGSGSATCNRTILITGAVARDLTRRYSKEGLVAALIETARRPVDLRAYANYWANPNGDQSGEYSYDQYLEYIIRTEGAELTDPPPWYKSMVSGKIYTVPALKEGQAAVIVTGDTDRNKVQVMPGGNRVTVGIELPSNWDELMAEDFQPAENYEPLSGYYLS